MKPPWIPLNAHFSVYPDADMEQLCRCFLEKKIETKYHYLTPKQAIKWKEVHHKLSPAIGDEETRSLYAESVRWLEVNHSGTEALEVISLGCGAGNKDMEVLKQLEGKGVRCRYTPLDVSPSLVMMAVREAGKLNALQVRSGWLMDLSLVNNLKACLDAEIPSNHSRLFLFYGMLPGFHPDKAFGLLRSVLSPGDRVLVSANLVPGNDYPAEVRAALPGYRNPLTHEWLEILLLDSGFSREDYQFEWSVRLEKGRGEVLKMVLDARFVRDAALRLFEKFIPFKKGDALEVFRSYRYHENQIVDLAGKWGLTTEMIRVNKDRSEGVFCFGMYA